MTRSIICDVNEAVRDLAALDSVAAPYGHVLPDDYARRLREAMMRLPPLSASEKTGDSPW
jgi:hypothetical protein